ncbi:BQ2448_4254 [Microbotryum intermedium]|uniref:BQ2448_4254 protein n=1 Tax=Microbotryum intermedium TaxID=269621 RepID=A0A238FHK1_9BASI|nr:BQ2448_4254 [Microbotryum intermedium]
MVSNGNSLGLASTCAHTLESHTSRSPSIASSSGRASDRDMAMHEGNYSLESEDRDRDRDRERERDREADPDLEEESADDSDFLDDDHAGNSSSLSLAITSPAVATPRPNSLTTPWPFNQGSHGPSPLSTMSYASISHPTVSTSSAPVITSTEAGGSAAPLATTTPIPASSLPHEILLHILRLLPAASLSPALLVCKAWCQCGVELLWHKPSFTSLPSLSGMLQVIHSPEQTFPYPTFIRRLNFSTLHEEMTDKVLRKLLPCVRLERLTLAGCRTLGSKSLIALLSNCSRLAALDLSDVVEVDDEVCQTIARSCPKLQGLNLSGCKEVTDLGMEAIARRCKSLRRIKLRQVSLISDTSVILLSINCPLLLEVDLIGCTRLTSLSLLQIFRTSPALRELSLQGCAEITEDAFPSTSMIHSLGSMREYNMPVDPDRSTAPLPPLAAMDGSLVPRPIPIDASPRLKPFDHLRYLDLTSVALLTDDAVAGIVKYMPRIRNLILAKCGRLTDDAIHSISLLGKHLHYLHLGHVSNITDVAVTALARSCTRLRYIDLACCTRLTDLSVFELATNLPRLKRIGLVRVASITDEGIQALLQRTSLERIHLSYCENLSVLAIHHLLSCLPRLTHLSLTGVPSFRRSDLQTWCRTPPSTFNSHQRATFCVYSGKGVHELRRFLRNMHVEMEIEAATAAWNQSVTNEAHDNDRQAIHANVPGNGGGAVAPRAQAGPPRRIAFNPGSLQIPPHNPAARQARLLQQQQQQQQHQQQPNPHQQQPPQHYQSQQGQMPLQLQQLQLHPAPPFHAGPIPPRNGSTQRSNGGQAVAGISHPVMNDHAFLGRPSSTPPHGPDSLDSSASTSNGTPNRAQIGAWAWDALRNTGSYLHAGSSNLTRAGSAGPSMMAEAGRGQRAESSHSSSAQQDRLRGLDIQTNRASTSGDEGMRSATSPSTRSRPRGATLTRGNYRGVDEDEGRGMDGGAGAMTPGSATPSESDVEMG